MTLARTPKPATYQDVLDAPEHLVAEILGAELHLSPRPTYRHARAAVRLGRHLGPFDEPGPEDPGGWVILVEPEVHLAPHVVVPDLAGWRRERMPEITDAPYTEVVPDWVCEILSPGTQRQDRMLKMPIYGRTGVSWLWLLDPLAEVVEVFRAEGGGWRIEAQAAGAGAVRLPPFEAIELDPGAWFSR